MQNLNFVYELYIFLILKKCLVFFSKHTLLFWHGSLMTQWVKGILLITKISHFSYFLLVSVEVGYLAQTDTNTSFWNQF